MPYSTARRRANAKALMRNWTCDQCGKTIFALIGSFRTHKLWCNPDGHVARFWASVDKRGPDECWNWTAQVRWDGYGRFVIMRKPHWTHRYSWELHNGKKIPKGASVLHSCHNPTCVNPKHLRLGTHQENMEESRRAGRFKETIAITKGAV